MNTVTYNIPIELNNIGGYTVSELKEKLMVYALALVDASKKEKNPLRKINVSERIKSLSDVPATPSTSDYKDEIVEVLSEKY